MLNKNKNRLFVGQTRSAFVLLIVLVAVVLMSLSAYSFSILMLSEDEAAQLTGRRIQSGLLCQSGAESVRMFLAQGEEQVRDSGNLYDNPEMFQARLVRKDAEPTPETTGYYSIIAPALEDSSGYFNGFRYGLVDESSKLNLNVLPKLEELQEGSGKNLLLALPEMTEEIADAILDWLDTDSEERPAGAESGYYQSQDPPYLAKNGSLSSVEELLRVRGVTPELLFGNDVNRNGVLDPEEELDDISVSDDPDAALGWANFLTIYSQEANRNWEGQTRINVNQDDLETLISELESELNEQWVRFIVAYRINGPYSGEVPDETENGPTQGEFDLENSELQFKFQSVLDIVGATTSVTYEGEEDLTVLPSPVPAGTSLEEMQQLGEGVETIMDRLTTVASSTVPGRVNIMQAPRRILLGIPGMTEEIVDEIIAKRVYETPEGLDLLNRHKRYETWIMFEMPDLVPLETMKALLPFICAKGDVYRAEIIGYFDSGEATSRAEAVFDTTEPVPRLLLWRDKSHLPLGDTATRYGISELDEPE